VTQVANPSMTDVDELAGAHTPFPPPYRARSMPPLKLLVCALVTIDAITVHNHLSGVTYLSHG